MPSYVSTSVFSDGTSVEMAIENLLDLGIENIELSSVHRYEENILAVPAHFKANFITHNFFPPIQNRLVLNIASADDKIRQESIEFIKEAIDYAEKMDIPLYTIHPGFLQDPVGESTEAKNFDFQFAATTTPISQDEYQKYFDRFLHAVKEIANFLQGRDVKVAVETQGSVSKKEVVLFTKPAEFKSFCQEIKSDQIGLNLNLGHLNLAAAAWGFDRSSAIQEIKHRIFAVEVTHNDGVEDEHGTLVEGAWYWDILKDPYFKNIPVIFEGRNIPEAEIVKSYDMIKHLVG